MALYFFLTRQTAYAALPSILFVLLLSLHSAPTQINIVTTDASSCGSRNGSATINVVNITGGLEYSIDKGHYQASPLFDGLSAGIHEVRIRPSGEGPGCTCDCAIYQKFTINSAVLNTYYADADNDGYGNPAITKQSCSLPEGFVTDKRDCNDQNPRINPGSFEINGDGLDNNCNGIIDPGFKYVDRDHDGYGDVRFRILADEPYQGYVFDSTDCNDLDPDTHPGAPEINGDCWDSDCNGAIEKGCQYRDLDQDGYGDPGWVIRPPQGELLPGFVLNKSDCDDSNPNIHPGGAEICDGLDNNCNGAVDEGLPQVYFLDMDGDGYGDPGLHGRCYVRRNTVTNNLDCHDGNPEIHPGQSELCDGVDNDCDGLVDEGVTLNLYFKDADFDGFGDPSNKIETCIAPRGFISDNADCNDNDPAISPRAPEICDNKDNDCDGEIDEEVKTIFYRDSDGDGYGTLSDQVEKCCAPAGYICQGGDCDDQRADIYPGAAEICDSTDNNCNGVTDEGLTIQTYFRDEDKDGYGTGNNTKQSCTAPQGYVNVSGDPDDNNSSIFPGATERCNGRDDNGNGIIDEGFVRITYYKDADGDGYGNPLKAFTTCGRPAFYVTNNTDCNDSSSNVYLGAPENCDDIDNNCDGQIDEGVLDTFYRDQDNDGFGNPAMALLGCKLPPGYRYLANDCSDNNPNAYPGAPEICNNMDDNCDGQIDETCPGLPQLNINDTTVFESLGIATLVVSLSKRNPVDVTVRYEANDGTAIKKKDFEKQKGILIIPADSLTGVISIVIVSDNEPESTEYFEVMLSKPENAIINDRIGRITITEGTLPQLPLQNTTVEASPVNAAYLEADKAQRLKVEVKPNPSNHYFILQNKSSGAHSFTIKVSDALGRLVEMRNGVYLNSNLTFGHNYFTGIYYMEVLQGTEKIVFKLIKN